MKPTHGFRKQRGDKLGVLVIPWYHAYKLPCGSALAVRFEAASAESAQLIMGLAANFAADELPPSCRRGLLT